MAAFCRRDFWGKMLILLAAADLGYSPTPAGSVAHRHRNNRPRCSEGVCTTSEAALYLKHRKRNSFPFPFSTGCLALSLVIRYARPVAVCSGFFAAVYCKVFRKISRLFPVSPFSLRSQKHILFLLRRRLSFNPLLPGSADYPGISPAAPGAAVADHAGSGFPRGLQN